MYKLRRRPSFICQIRNGEQKGYMLKNKELTGPTKGTIYLEVDVIYNTVSVFIYTVMSVLRHMTGSKSLLLFL